MQRDTREIELPADVHARVEQRLPRTDFESVGAYVAFVMNEVLAEVEASTTEDYDAVEEREIQDRLESLGYLDH